MASKRQSRGLSTTSTSVSRVSASSKQPSAAETVEVFADYCERMVFDDGAHRPPEGWQLEIARDIRSRRDR
jgi:hypothetical protein